MIKNKNYIRNLASVFKHIKKKYNMGHCLTLCTHIYICNTQIVALETKKSLKNNTRQWCQSMASLVLYLKTKVFQWHTKGHRM